MVGLNVTCGNEPLLHERNQRLPRPHGRGGCREGAVQGGAGWGKNTHGSKIQLQAALPFPPGSASRLAWGYGGGVGKVQARSAALLEHRRPVDVPPPPKPLSNAAVNHSFLCSRLRRRRKLHRTVRRRSKTMPSASVGSARFACKCSPRHIHTHSLSRIHGH